MDISDFRKVMGRFPTGVTVVTSRLGDELHGMTCNAFLSVSIAPPTVLVSLARDARTTRLIEKSRVFAVNLLSDAQVALSDRFAGRDKDKEANRFEGFDWAPAATGAPVFRDVLAYLDCRVRSAFDGGDHTLYVGEVAAAALEDARRPLLFFQSKYLGLDSVKPL